MNDQDKFSIFCKKLEKLSKECGVVIQAVGGVSIGNVKSVVYDNDSTSGDLIPSVEWE